MTALLLIFALVLVVIGVDIFRFPELRKLTQREQEKYVFGDRAVSDAGRNWMMRRACFASGNTMRFLAVILIAAGLCLAARALQLI